MKWRAYKYSDLWRCGSPIVLLAAVSVSDEPEPACSKYRCPEHTNTDVLGTQIQRPAGQGLQIHFAHSDQIYRASGNQIPPSSRTFIFQPPSPASLSSKLCDRYLLYLLTCTLNVSSTQKVLSSKYLYTLICNAVHFSLWAWRILLNKRWPIATAHHV